MTQDKIDQLLSLATLAPTAFNQQNIRFVIMDDLELRQQIRVAAHHQAQITDASLLIVLCADTKAWQKNPQRYWENAPSNIQQLMNTAIDNYYRNREQVQHDEAIRSAGIAAQTTIGGITNSRSSYK